MNTAEASPKLLSRRRVGWPASAVVNAVLGYLGVLPLLLVAYVLDNTVLVGLGWSEPDSKFATDDASVQAVVALVAAAFFVLIFLAVNLALSRFFSVSGTWYWLLACLLAVTPFVVSLIAPDFWTAVRWY